MFEKVTCLFQGGEKVRKPNGPLKFVATFRLGVSFLLLDTTISRSRYLTLPALPKTFLTNRLNEPLANAPRNNMNNDSRNKGSQHLTISMKNVMAYGRIVVTLIAASLISTTSSGANIPSTLSIVPNATIDAKSGPWSEILEEYAVLGPDSSDATRSSRIMKFDEKALKITNTGLSSNKKDVSETDLYLLGAIEKLVYRVDFLEKRLRRAEELLYYVISSGNSDGKEPCPSNYTRIEHNCYHFSDREFDWKSSASLCRGMGGRLVEFDTNEEREVVAKWLRENKRVIGKSFWTGGLNPGLLWIWASSAKPVHRDMKQAVRGDGRCLALHLTDKGAKNHYYKGDDCGTRQRYICQLATDDDAANKLEATARRLLHAT